MSMEIAMQAAEKGLAWLKESGPIYGLDVNEVDIEELSLRSCRRCVLGQLGTDYKQVMTGLIVRGVVSRAEVNDWVNDHGFESTADSEYYELDQAWRILLERDRAL